MDGWMDVATHTEVVDNISPLWYLLLLLLNSKAVLLNDIDVSLVVLCDWFRVLIYDICNVSSVALKGTNRYSPPLFLKRNPKHTSTLVS